MKASILFIVFILIALSCQSTFEPANSSIPYGTWIYSSIQDSVYIYYFANKLEKDKPGFAIKRNNVFIERTSGWCGTPPLSFFNIEGKWKYLHKNEIEIISTNWSNENFTRIMKIVSSSNQILKVIFYH